MTLVQVDTVKIVVCFPPTPTLVLVPPRHPKRHGAEFTFEDLENELPHCYDAPVIPQAPNDDIEETDADLGHANVITRDLLRSIALYLPFRSRLVLCDRVCKLWRGWLREENVIFNEVNISMGKYGGDNKWLTADKVSGCECRLKGFQHRRISNIQACTGARAF